MGRLRSFHLNPLCKIKNLINELELDLTHSNNLTQTANLKFILDHTKHLYVTAQIGANVYNAMQATSITSRNLNNELTKMYYGNNS